MRNLPGPWLADISANFLAIVLVVLIVAARFQPPARGAPEAIGLTARAIAPQGGADAVELLRLRLVMNSDRELIDLTPGGPERFGTTGGAPVLYILDQSFYEPVTASLRRAGRDWRELVPPEALRQADGGWNKAYLDLFGVADDPARFRSALSALLDRSARARTSILPRESDTRTGGATGRLRDWLRIGRDAATGLLVSLAGLVLLFIRRWAFRA